MFFKFFLYWSHGFFLYETLVGVFSSDKATLALEEERKNCHRLDTEMKKDRKTGGHCERDRHIGKEAERELIDLGREGGRHIQRDRIR
jgi:hypothetical protein